MFKDNLCVLFVKDYNVLLLHNSLSALKSPDTVQQLLLVT